MTGRRRALVVDDDAGVRQSVRIACERDGYAVQEAALARAVVDEVKTFEPDIVLLDLVLPDGSGLDVCRALRRAGARMPIIIMSGKGDEVDVVVGLEVGADDYVIKPLRPRELLARMSAQLRSVRTVGEEDAGRIVFQDLVIDTNERRVVSGDRELALTHTEFDLLTLLASNAGRPVSRDEMLHSVWGYDVPVETRTIDVHVHNLRRKLEQDPAKPVHILAVPGIGYRLTVARPES